MKTTQRNKQFYKYDKKLVRLIIQAVWSQVNTSLRALNRIKPVLCITAQKSLFNPPFNNLLCDLLWQCPLKKYLYECQTRSLIRNQRIKVSTQFCCLFPLGEPGAPSFGVTWVTEDKIYFLRMLTGLAETEAEITVMETSYKLECDVQVKMISFFFMPAFTFF